MPTSRVSAAVTRSADPIRAYARKLGAADAAICKQLQSEIVDVLPRASGRIWHGAPVWFVGQTPVVGYNVTARGGVNLLFWNGQAFGEPMLSVVGKFKAAQLHFDAVSDIDAKLVRRCLKKAGSELWDHSAIRKRPTR